MGWSEPFFWRWLLVRMTTMTLPALLCFHWGAGVVGLAVMAIGALPWPLRVAFDTNGLALTALMARARWPTETLERVFVEVDSRPLAWPRRQVLVIQRRGRAPARVFGSPRQLEELARSARALGLG